MIAAMVLSMAPLSCSHHMEKDPYRKYIPGPVEARQALNLALAAWKQAHKRPEAGLKLTGVQFVDQQFPPEQPLEDFEILGETEVGNVRQFAVRVQLDAEKPATLVRYNLFGRDPIWVYRLEDFELISHWEHKMDDSSPVAPPPTHPAQDSLPHR
jgi:hypothetical protein